VIQAAMGGKRATNSYIELVAVYPPVERALGINISNYALGLEHA
jgi:hypothetical protein